MNYRRNVALILRRADGHVLVCERSDYRGSWQFPQGGCHPDETDEAALAREVREEISLAPTDYRVVTSRGPYRYEFRHGFRKEGFGGQAQIYFLADIRDGAEHSIVVDRHEFQSFRWIDPAIFEIDWVPPIKRDVYRAVFRDFFSVELD